MNMRDGTVVSEKMESVVPPLVCRDVKATKRRFNPSNGGTFTNTGTEIRIPISGQFVLDNKNVNCNFTVNSNQSCSVDYSVAGLFSQIRVEAGTGSSVVLESIDDPGVWANFLYQYTWTHEDMARENSKQRSSPNQPGPARLAVASQAANAGSPVVAAQTAITARVAGILDKIGDTFNGDLEVALDLSLFMGIFSASAGLPLYDTAGVTIVLTLNNPSNSIYSATAPTLSLKQIYVSATCLEGGESYEKKLKELKTSGNKEISVMYNTCRRYVQSQAATGATTTGTYLINERSKSCLGFVAIARDTATIVKADSFSNSNSLFPDVKRFEYNIAGMSYPIAGISTISEAIDETYDVYSHLSRRHDSGGLISRVQSTTVVASTGDQTAAMDSQTGASQVLSINLSKCGPNENYWGKGMNLSGSNLTNYLQVQYTAWNAQTINIYSIFQMKLHIDAMGNFTTEF
jgi:hypothetical protein